MHWAFAPLDQPEAQNSRGQCAWVISSYANCAGIRVTVSNASAQENYGPASGSAKRRVRFSKNGAHMVGAWVSLALLLTHFITLEKILSAKKMITPRRKGASKCKRIDAGILHPMSLRLDLDVATLSIQPVAFHLSFA
jgi:hypothetical protein